MKRKSEQRWIGLLLSTALLWGIGTALELAVTSIAVPVAQAQSAQGNPCAPKANPCAPKANPCSPGVGKANPCNPCAAKANPCSSAGAASAAATIGWGKDYVTYDRTTGFVMSASHSNRLVVTYVYPPKAAAIYRANAKLVRTNKSAGFSDYPVGTLIAKESFERGADGTPDRRGPVFFMRKEKAGYDPSGENWRYAFTQADFSLIGEGVKDNVEFCKACHAAVRARHFVYAQDR